MDATMNTHMHDLPCVQVTRVSADVAGVQDAVVGPVHAALPGADGLPQLRPGQDPAQPPTL